VGALGRAAALYASIVRLWPHDLLALRLAQSCCFLLATRGRCTSRGACDALLARGHAWLRLRARDARLRARGDRRIRPGAGVGRRALEIAPRNPVAVHAVAHALASAGDPLAGLHWMESRTDDWSNDGAMTAHNWWHVALFHLALGRGGRALAIYDAEIAPMVAASATDAADAAALLWRLELNGTDVGQRWQAVAEAFALRPMPALWPLVDVHAAMAFAAATRARELDRLRSALAGAGPVAREVALPVARGLERSRRASTRSARRRSGRAGAMRGGSAEARSSARSSTSPSRPPVRAPRAAGSRPPPPLSALSAPGSADSPARSAATSSAAATNAGVSCSPRKITPAATPKSGVMKVSTTAAPRSTW